TGVSQAAADHPAGIADRAAARSGAGLCAGVLRPSLQAAVTGAPASGPAGAAGDQCCRDAGDQSAPPGQLALVLAVGTDVNINHVSHSGGFYGAERMLLDHWLQVPGRARVLLR